MKQVRPLLALGIAFLVAFFVTLPQLFGSLPARAAGEGGASGASTVAEVARLQAEVDRLKQEVREQRQLILQLMQAEQQRYDAVLKYLQTIGGAGGRESATVTGKVRTSGQPLGEAYVYLDGPRSSPTRGQTVEIKQKDKQFAPRVAVVPLGTRVVFPKQDTVIHNVFSTAAGNAFDLGSIKGGETSSPVSLLKPGPIEVFCNIHAKMRSDILVVPNGHWTRVAADGSFSLSGIP